MCNECNEEQVAIYKGLDQKWHMRVENNHWNDDYDEFDFTDVKIEYCPYCGVKLGE